MYTDANNKDNYSSKRRGSAIKRVLASLILAGGLLVAGAQSTPTSTQASAPCDMTCTQMTDPNTGLLAPSPYDITHVVTSVVEHSFGARWQLSAKPRSSRHHFAGPAPIMCRYGIIPGQRSAAD